ncbi:MAG: T9SS type A sorting domain-containing protein, partial [Hymenobacter sp.]
ASLGLWYDDYSATATDPVTAQLNNVLTFTTGIEKNDTTLKAAFPYVQAPWSGTKAQLVALAQIAPSQTLGLAPVLMMASAYPNPSTGLTTLHLELAQATTLSVQIYDALGRQVTTIAAKKYPAGVNEIKWQPSAAVAPGQYIASLYAGSTLVQSLRIERQ